MRRLKVLMVSNRYYPYEIGGAEMSTRRLVNCLCSIGLDVTVLTTTSKEKGEERDTVDGVSVIRFFPKNEYWVYEKPSQQWKKVLWHLRELYNPLVGEQIRAYLAELKPDIVHTQNIDSFSPIVWKVAHEMGCKVVHTARDGHLLCPKANFVHQNLDDKYCGSVLCNAYRFWKVSFTKYIDVFCSPSKFLLVEYQTHGLLAKNCAVIPDGFDVEKFFKLRDMPRESNSILYLGHLSEVKGLNDLHEALIKINDIDWVLHIAGKGPLEPEVKKWTADPRIFYHGYVNFTEKLELLGKCAILAMPSRCFQNLPEAVIEGLLSGFVVVTPKRGGTVEIMARFPNGITYNPKQPNALHLSIRDALRTAEIRKSNSGDLELDKMTLDWYSVTRMLHNYNGAYISEKNNTGLQ